MIIKIYNKIILTTNSKISVQMKKIIGQGRNKMIKYNKKCLNNKCNRRWTKVVYAKKGVCVILVAKIALLFLTKLYFITIRNCSKMQNLQFLKGKVFLYYYFLIQTVKRSGLQSEKKLGGGQRKCFFMTITKNVRQFILLLAISKPIVTRQRGNEISMY